jgi:hypothetical protein
MIILEEKITLIIIPLLQNRSRKEFLSSRVSTLKRVFKYTFSRYSTVLFSSKIIHFRPFSPRFLIKKSFRFPTV